MRLLSFLGGFFLPASRTHQHVAGSRVNIGQGDPLIAQEQSLACDFYLNREVHTQSVTTVTPQEYQYSGFVPHSAQSSSFKRRS
jgi:hypothetical protein